MKKTFLLLPFFIMMVTLSGCLSLPGPSTPQQQYTYYQPATQQPSYQSNSPQGYSPQNTDEEIFRSQILPIYVYYKGLISFESKYVQSVSNQVMAPLGGSSASNYKSFMAAANESVKETMEERMKELKTDLRYSKSTSGLKTASDALETRINQYLGATNLDPQNLDNIFATHITLYKILPSDVNKQILDYAEFLKKTTNTSLQKRLDNLINGSLKLQ